MRIYPGKMVLYRWRPGQVRAGLEYAAALVTKVYPDQSADLTIHPAMSRDPIFQERVPMSAGPDQFHCWRPNDDEERIAALEQRIAELEAALAERKGRNESRKKAEALVT